jgi:archaellum biogenesis protein FlaJ (TadC family)
LPWQLGRVTDFLKCERVVPSILKPEIPLRFKSIMSIAYYVRVVLCVLEGWNVVTTLVFHTRHDKFCHSTHLTIGTQQSSERWETVSCALGRTQCACVLILMAESVAKRISLSFSTAGFIYACNERYLAS